MTDIKIAGLKKVSQWKVLRDMLNSKPTDELWQQAFDDFLVTRVKTRYYDPIEAISKITAQQGKGFSIVTIYCSLIEFFETQLKGFYFENRNYKDSSGAIVKSKTRKDKKGNSLPLPTGELFTQFLTQNEPFKSHFKGTLAKEFYENVRCAILHQAETSGNWIIRDGKDSDTIIRKETTNTILLWKPLKKSFDAFLKSYEKLLKTNVTIQKNFIVKWDKIAKL